MVYFLKRYLFWVVMTFGALSLIIFVADLVEQFRRTTSTTTMEVWDHLQLVAYKLPYLGLTLLPFIVVIGSTIAFSSMALSREYLVLRSVGISIYRFMVPFSVTILGLGYGIVFYYQPIAVHLFQQYVKMDREIAPSDDSGPQSQWFRQVTQDGYVIFNVEEFEARKGQGGKTHFFEFAADGTKREEITADSMVLTPGAWVLTNAQRLRPLTAVDVKDHLKIETSMTLATLPLYLERIDSLRLSDLKKSMDLFKNLGGGSVRYEVQYFSLLLLPFFYLGLLWCVGGLSLGLSSRQSITSVVLQIAFLGFILYLLRDFATVLAITGKIPPLWGGMAPALCSLLLGLGFMIRSEGH